MADFAGRVLQLASPLAVFIPGPGWIASLAFSGVYALGTYLVYKGGEADARAQARSTKVNVLGNQATISLVYARQRVSAPVDSR